MNLHWVQITANKLNFDWPYSRLLSDGIRVELKNGVFQYPSAALFYIPGRLKMLCQQARNRQRAKPRLNQV